MTGGARSSTVDAPAVDEVRITEPGVYDLDEAAYFADPVPWGSLSNSGAKLLLPPSCPALYRYWSDHPRPPKKTFDHGHAAHREVLGTGAEIICVEAVDWCTKAAQERRDRAHAIGATPLLAAEYERVLAMAGALRAHPFAGALFDPISTLAERSLFWTDPETEVMRRARLDISARLPNGRAVVVDYKSCVSAEPERCSKAMYDYGYHRQGAWYLDGAQALGLGDEDTAFLLVWQEKDPPHLVTVTYPDPIALRAAREDNRRALELYARCVSADDWPSYASDVIPLSLPAWAERRYLEEYE